MALTTVEEEIGAQLQDFRWQPPECSRAALLAGRPGAALFWTEAIRYNAEAMMCRLDTAGWDARLRHPEFRARLARIAAAAIAMLEARHNCEPAKQEGQS